VSNVELCALSIAEASGLLRARRLSPSELTQAHLERIDRMDRELRAFVTVTADRALEDARRAEREIASGAWRGALHGIPIALKDIFDTAGVRTSAGSRVFEDRVPSRDSEVAKCLKAAGAVLLGKLRLSEFAIGRPYPDEAIPTPRNPWGRDRTTGGSSSGSGAALAAGLCGGSFGTDTAGSIRTPASYCGIVGLKPSYGLVSVEGVTPLAWSFDHAGPMARTVTDTAILLDGVTAGGHVAGLHAPLGRVRLGVPRAFIASRSGLQPDVLAAFDRALDVLTQLGVIVSEVEFPWLEDVEGVIVPILLVEAAALHEARLSARGSELGRHFRERVPAGLLFSGVDYVQAQRGRADLCRAAATLMREVDLLAMPTKTSVAPTLAAQLAAGWGPFADVFNATGQPSISIPCGFDREGLPIGLMLSGRVGDDTGVLRAARAYEAATPWHTQRPALDVS
jgi:aspartyl-tRNA(Asn)/glutamyl-tRNA(Gln) amidotransferase subunit A